MAKQKEGDYFKPDMFKDWVFPMNGGPGEKMRQLIAANRREKAILSPNKQSKHASHTGVGTVLDSDNSEVLM